MNTKLLVIDDDPAMCLFLEVGLKRHGFQVQVAHDAVSGLDKVCAFQPDLVLLDVMMPDMDGWEVCGRLRQTSDVPIIMFTALSAEQHLMHGLDQGADSYLVKPVAIQELVARIRAVLRRAGDSRYVPPQPTSLVRHGSLVIDLEGRQVRLAGQPVQLTPTEFRLLSTLARHPGRLLPYDYLLDQVWGPGCGGDKHRLGVHMSNLRQKIEPDPSEPELISSERNVGYQFG